MCGEMRTGRGVGEGDVMGTWGVNGSEAMEDG